MRILFAGANGYLPEFNGGAQSSTDHLVRMCRKSGHEAAVLAALYGDGLFGFKARAKLKLGGKPVVGDHQLGYEVMRAWFPWEAAPYVSHYFRPDVVLIQCYKAVPLAKAFAAQRVPVVLYFRNVQFNELDGDPREIEQALFIANSQFTAAEYCKKFQINCTVVTPTVDFAKYASLGHKQFATLINVYPEKGFERALEIAQCCPDIPFLFVEGWRLSKEHHASILDKIRLLPNVTFLRRTDDMRSVYGRTKVLLAPSKWEEAWGRVASEAHCSAIPVIGSSRGGLPEAIGPGGIILDYDAPLDAWVSALKQLWSDDILYNRLSVAALAYAKRPEMNPGHQYRIFMDVLEQAVFRSEFMGT